MMMHISVSTQPLIGCNTRSIFKRSTADLKLEFIFSYTGYCTKVNKSGLLESESIASLGYRWYSCMTQIIRPKRKLACFFETVPFIYTCGKVPLHKKLSLGRGALRIR